jgi:hypothetical protein
MMPEPIAQLGSDPGTLLRINETDDDRLRLYVNAWGHEVAIVLSAEEEELLLAVLRARGNRLGRTQNPAIKPQILSP